LGTIYVINIAVQIENSERDTWRRKIVDHDDILALEGRGETPLWLKGTPSRWDILAQLKKEENYTRGVTFVVRTFLYAGYADVHGLYLTPDATRLKIVKPLADAEEDLQNQLLKRFQAAVTQRGQRRYGQMGNIREHIPPLAAIVFKRAGSDKTKIPKVMRELRKQLAPLRKSLRDDEVAIGEGGQKEMSAIRKWERVYQELHETVGVGKPLVTLRSLANFGQALADLGGDFVNAGNWSKAIFGLPLEVATRVATRRSAIEIFELAKDLPGPAALWETTRALFGEIKFD
jgi:hypothetical protein